MRFHLLSIPLLILCIMVMPRPASAQSPYDIGVSFSEYVPIIEGYIPEFPQPTPLYFVMFDLGERILGYENSVSITGPNADNWAISRQPLEGLDVDPDPDGYVVGIGYCAGTVGQHYTMYAYDFFYVAGTTAPRNTLVCMGPATVSNPSIPGFPSYQTCSSVLASNGLFEDIWSESACHGCALINPWEPKPCSVVASQTESWGALKAKF